MAEFAAEAHNGIAVSQALEGIAPGAPASALAAQRGRRRAYQWSTFYGDIIKGAETRAMQAGAEVDVWVG